MDPDAIQPITSRSPSASGPSSSSPPAAELREPGQLHPETDWPVPPTKLNVTRRSQGFKFRGIALKRVITTVGNCVRTRSTATTVSIAGFDTRETLRNALGGRLEGWLDIRQRTGSDIKEQCLVRNGKQQYIVIGVFNKGSNEPREAIFELGPNTPLSSILQRGIIKARGWRYFLSLKVVHRFGIYVCDIDNGTHRRIILNARQQQIVNQIYYEYVTSAKHCYWNEWIFDTISNNGLSIELLLGWSVVRISVVVSFPVMLSFAIGMWYMQKTGDVQTAWTIASYVVTGVGVLIALFGVVTAIGGV